MMLYSVACATEMAPNVYEWLVKSLQAGSHGLLHWQGLSLAWSGFSSSKSSGQWIMSHVCLDVEEPELKIGAWARFSFVYRGWYMSSLRACHISPRQRQKVKGGHTFYCSALKGSCSTFSSWFTCNSFLHNPFFTQAHAKLLFLLDLSDSFIQMCTVLIGCPVSNC